MRPGSPRYKAVFNAAVALVEENPNCDESAPELLKLLGAALGCEWGSFWLVDARSQFLRVISTWRVPAVRAEELERDTLQRTLSLSEGNAGHVWRTRKPIWTRDLVRDMCIPRSLDARNAGLQGGIWFALQSDETVYGVIELLGRDVERPSKEAILAIEMLGGALGKLIEDAQPESRAKSR